MSTMISRLREISEGGKLRPPIVRIPMKRVRRKQNILLRKEMDGDTTGCFFIPGFCFRKPKNHRRTTWRYVPKYPCYVTSANSIPINEDGTAEFMWQTIPVLSDADFKTK